MKYATTLAITLFLAALSPICGAQTKISELPDAAALAGDEQVPAVQLGSTVKTTPAAQTVYTLNALAGVSPFTPAGAWRYTFPGTAANPSIYLNSTFPRFDMFVTGGSRWSMQAQAGEFGLHSCSTNGVTCGNVLRSLGSIGGNVSAVTLGDADGSTITIDGANSPLVVGGSAGTSGQVLTSTGNATAPTWQNASSGTGGTYAPTLTAVANSSNVVVTGGCQYMQVGATVTVSCLVGYDQTASGVTTRIAISLPVASALSAIGQLAGAGADAQGITSCASGVYADFANDRAEFRNTCAVTGGREVSLTFTYRVI